MCVRVWVCVRGGGCKCPIWIMLYAPVGVDCISSCKVFEGTHARVLTLQGIWLSSLTRWCLAASRTLGQVVHPWGCRKPVLASQTAPLNRQLRPRVSAQQSCEFTRIRYGGHLSAVTVYWCGYMLKTGVYWCNRALSGSQCWLYICNTDEYSCNRALCGSNSWKYGISWNGIMWTL